jgi:hypothetical protein
MKRLSTVASSHSLAAKAKSWKASVPYIDIRTGRNLTGNKRSIDDFRDKSTAEGLVTNNIDNIPGWNRKDLEF